MVGVPCLMRGDFVFEAGLKRIITVTAGVMAEKLSTTYCKLLTAGCLLVFLLFPSTVFPSDAESALAEMQRRYSSVDTISGSFTLTNYPIPGVEQVEKGVFWLKKPALMRWEYSYPEEALFVADGKESFIFDPQNNQVTVQSLTTEELLSTPLNLLLGAGDIEKSFLVEPEDAFKPSVEGNQIIRLKPRSETDYSLLILEIDDETSDLVRLIIQEQDENTREYLFTDLKLDDKVSKEKFKFIIPEDAEVHRMERLE